MLISALIAIFESTASVLPSALSESTSCVRTGYKEDTDGISDVAFDEFGRVCQHGRIRTNTIFPDFGKIWSMRRQCVPGSPFRPRL